ncbi:hypothetical protein BGZ51_007606 [Haplosporangium sp. Z 767]|nr:hypothetical protein BGZ51_007606 [Haplosporangium sp. Z 767]KAF9179120.1 hypothetical protein BGZ50_007217 [Haplosporangium sp. Z 11]
MSSLSLKKSSIVALRICRRHVSNSSRTNATAETNTAAEHVSVSSRKRESYNPGLNRDKFLVGNPHPVSNLRPVQYPIPANESTEDRLFRERRERVDAFNQNFWVNNNSMFNRAKAEYEEKVRAQNGNQPVTTEEFSIFYKDFLDKAYERQMNYNRQWWVENMGLLLPAAKAALRKWTTRSSSSS